MADRSARARATRSGSAPSPSGSCDTSVRGTSPHRPIRSACASQPHRESTSTASGSFDVSDRRATSIVFRILERRRLEPRRLEEREISGVPPVRPARDIALRNCRCKTRRLRDGPVSQQTATAAARHTHLLLIDVAALDQLIDAGHQIFVIVAGIIVLDDVPKLLPVARAAARVRINHDVTLRRHPLKLMIEDETVSRVRSAVNVQNQRVLLARIEVGWLLYPRLNLLTVKARVPDFFRFGEIEFRDELVVNVCELSRLAACFVEPE